MIVVNYWLDLDCDRFVDGATLSLQAIINDQLDLDNDIQLIKDAIDNDEDFDPKAEHLYEIYLTRATIASDPIPEPAFCIDHVVTKVQDLHDDGLWITPLVRL